MPAAKDVLIKPEVMCTVVRKMVQAARRAPVELDAIQGALLSLPPTHKTAPRGPGSGRVGPSGSNLIHWWVQQKFGNTKQSCQPWNTPAPSKVFDAVLSRRLACHSKLLFSEAECPLC